MRVTYQNLVFFSTGALIAPLLYLQYDNYLSVALWVVASTLLILILDYIGNKRIEKR